MPYYCYGCGPKKHRLLPHGKDENKLAVSNVVCVNYARSGRIHTDKAAELIIIPRTVVAFTIVKDLVD